MPLVAWPDLNADLGYLCRTVPTQDQVLVPETLLKKRKSQEKARQERLLKFEKDRIVGRGLFLSSPGS